MLRTQDIASGGQLAHYMTSANPLAIIYRIRAGAADFRLDRYIQLAAATLPREAMRPPGDQRRKILVDQCWRPVGTTYVSVCVWPAKPDRDHCSIDN
jgi:hypothetical protein